MPKKNNRKKNNIKKPARSTFHFALPGKTKRYVFGVLMLLFGMIIGFSFFDLAGVVGIALKKGLLFLIGKVFFLLPLFFALSGAAFIKSDKRNVYYPTLLAVFILIFSIAGVLGTLDLNKQFNSLPAGASHKFQWNYSGEGGWIGFLISLPIHRAFGFWVTQIIFLTFVVIGCTILWQVFSKRSEPKAEKVEPETQSILIKKIFGPRFKVKEITSTPSASRQVSSPVEVKSKELPAKTPVFKYENPPLDLLENDKGTPASGDIRQNSAIIKKTLQNFDITVEMSEVNIGPTVTQYTLKPAEGVKLSKITSLSNDLALALAAHPIRIEAPIPGRPLVGVEIPNKVRTQVRLRNLLERQEFQDSSSNLLFPLGRDVAGNPCFADLAKMPHLLVAGSTGSGKTICLNSIIISLLYKNSPEALRFILVDPKRVEFPVYSELPHLLCPVIYDAQKAVNALKWLIKEMERRFDVLAEAKSRDIAGYNNKITKSGDSFMPYIILIVDELADLMAARGKDIEAGIVRLAQMARAVGIHLIVATQRPSVEVITGLIKANITSRITFQVASQVDSRTVLDMAGAEKLLGYGDLLYVSSDIAKPRRMQGVFITEKETRRVTDYIKSKAEVPELDIEADIGAAIKNGLAEDLKIDLEASGEESVDLFYGGEEDPLYEEAKRVIIEARKASASLLQRRLRIGYARAARLLDMLEERGVVGPADGAKPREVYFKNKEENQHDDEWQKV